MPTRLQLSDPLTLEALAQVSADTLVPSQQPTPRGLLQKTDCYQQRFLKYPDIAVCHSYAEFIHLICLEMDPDVSAFVPQPFKMKVRGYRKPYIPDCYVVRSGQPQVIEIKAEGGLEQSFNHQVATFLNWYDMPFSVISNEAILAYEQEARHWLTILQQLVCADKLGLDTQHRQYRLLEKALTMNSLQVADLLNPGQHDEQWLDDIALQRLIHEHRFKVDLRKAPYQRETELVVCT